MKLKRTISALILLTTLGGTVGVNKSFALEIGPGQKQIVPFASSDLKTVTQKVDELFKDKKHTEIFSTSCNFQSYIDTACEQVKQLPECQDKLHLSDLVYLANNLYFEARGAISLRQRAYKINDNLENYFVDSEHTCLTSNFTELYSSSDGNYGGLNDVVQRYEKLGLPSDTPSIKRDYGMIKKAYNLYNEGRIAVDIPDENFRLAINNKLNLPQNNTVFEKCQLRNIKDLDLMNYAINNLTGINDMQNLVSLKLADVPGLNFSIMSYSREEMLNSLETLVVKNMQNVHTSYVSRLRNLKSFEAIGGNVSDASPIIDHIKNVDIKDQKIITTQKLQKDSSLSLPLYNLLITNYGSGPRLCSQLDNFTASNNGVITGNTVTWDKSYLVNLNHVSCSWNSGQFSGEYIVYLQ